MHDTGSAVLVHVEERVLALSYIANSREHREGQARDRYLDRFNERMMANCQPRTFVASGGTPSSDASGRATERRSSIVRRVPARASRTMNRYRSRPKISLASRARFR